MRGTMKTKILMIGFLPFVFACSSMRELPPALDQRTLRISPSIAGLEYQWFECTKKFLGVCTRTEARLEQYDLNNVETRMQLLNMGFVGRVRERFIP